MRVISAPRQAAIADAGPVEKFSIAGTRPSAWSAKNVTSEARDVGSSTPTRSPGRVSARQHRTEREAAGHQPAIAQWPHLEIVGDEVAAAVLLARFEQRVEQRRIDPRGGEHRVHHLIAERAAQRDATRAAAHTVRRGQHARRQHANPDLRQEAPTDLAREPRERRELDAVDANREKRGLCPLGDDGRPFVDLHQRPGRGDAALGEDDAGRAGLDRANHRPNRQRIGRIDRKRVDEHEKRLRPPLLRDKRIDGEDRVARQKRAEQQPVQE